jgi:hypothetical protein
MKENGACLLHVARLVQHCLLHPLRIMIDTIELDHGSVSQLSHYVLSTAKGGWDHNLKIPRFRCDTAMLVQDWYAGAGLSGRITRRPILFLFFPVFFWVEFGHGKM